MGMTYIDGVVRGPEGREETVRFLVDSGAGYSLLPGPVWKAIGLEPIREQLFNLADGTQITRNVSECYLMLPECGASHATVVLGEVGDDQPLLGVITLENLGLVLNPFNRTLQPMRMMLS